MFDFKSRDSLSLHGFHLDDLTPADLEDLKALFGGKAAHLMLLANQSGDTIRVPPGIGLRHDVVAWATSRPEALEALVEKTILPALASMRDEHGGRAKYARLAVRSSGNLEDGAESGFPGVFSTVTDVVPDVRSVLEAIRAVLASGTTENVKGYCQNLGIPPSKIRMACILQWQVESVLSGVAMTSTNNSVRDQYLLLNFAKGHCRDVVDGKSNNEIVFTKDDPVVPVSANCRDFAHFFWDGREPHETFATRHGEALLSLKILADVARRCALIESLDHFRRPMDIEWTVDHDGDIFMLQARPIVHRQAIALKPGM